MILGATSGGPRCGGAAPQDELSGLVLRSLPNEPLPPLYPPRETGATYPRGPEGGATGAEWLEEG